MKKQVLLLMALLMSVVASAQKTIIMEKEAGVYKVPCTVNGVKMKFILDTGAASVSMSQSMAQFLLDGEYLSSSDFTGSGKSVLADGSVVNHAIVNLRDIEIAGMHIYNIEATVIEGQNAPLLLGQTAISELGRVTIDGNRLMIHAAEDELSQDQINQLNEQIDRLIDAGSWAAATDCLLKMENAVGLSEYGLFLLCRCYFSAMQWDECILTSKRWLREYESDDDLSILGHKGSVYSFLAGAYEYGKIDYNSALLWYQKQIDIWENCDLTHSHNRNYFDKRYDKESMASTYYSIGDCYYELKSYYQAISYYKKAVKFRCQYLNFSTQDLQNG